MKKLLIVGLMALAACSDNRSSIENINKNTEIMEKKDKQSIEQLLGEYKKSLNTSNAALSTSLYTKDGIFMPTNAPSAIGTENIKKTYEFILSQIQLNIEFFIEEIVIEGDLAFATTSSKGTTLIHASKQTVPEENRELFVFEKENGEWKIARYMFNKTK